MAIVTMTELLEAGIHFGHQTRRWHPKMKRYIYGQRNGIYIIDLQHTLRQTYKAYGMVRDAVAKGGTVLFVGTKKQAQEAVERESQRCGMYYVNNRWLGGTLTNFRTVRQSIQELKDLIELESSGKIEKYSKKEGVMFRKRRERLEKNLSGIKDMPALPSVIFVVDAKREAIAIREAERLHIPCIGIADTNCDPDKVSLPIPGNDDAIRSIGLFCSIIADAAIEGRTRAEKVRADEADKKAAIKEGADEGDLKPSMEETTRDQAVSPAPGVAAAPDAAGASGEETATPDKPAGAGEALSAETPAAAE